MRGPRGSMSSDQLTRKVRCGWGFCRESKSYPPNRTQMTLVFFIGKGIVFGGLTFKNRGSFGLSAVFEGLFHKRI